MFGRSYQEVEKGQHNGVENALDANDPDWRSRELIILPSHVSDIENDDAADDIDQMIDAAHNAGFDIVCATVVLSPFKGRDRQVMAEIWNVPWDERWTIPTPLTPHPEGQLEALGRDLWVWICRALAG